MHELSQPCKQLLLKCTGLRSSEPRIEIIGQFWRKLIETIRSGWCNLIDTIATTYGDVLPAKNTVAMCLFSRTPWAKPDEELRPFYRSEFRPHGI